MARGNVDPAEFVWLMQHEKRIKTGLEAPPKRRKRMVTRVKRKGCGSPEDDKKLGKRGWKKVACGVWRKEVL